MPAGAFNIEWSSVRGRNGFDPPTDLPDDMAAECLNVLVARGQIAVKRNGASSVGFFGASYTGQMSMFRFVPGQDDAAAEFLWVDNGAITPRILRVAGGTTAAELTRFDNISTRPQDAVWATLNGKAYVAYDSAVNRLHVFSPSEDATLVRRVGLIPQTAGNFAVTDTGSGTYAAVLRYYRICTRGTHGGVQLHAERQRHGGSHHQVRQYERGRDALGGRSEHGWVDVLHSRGDRGGDHDV